jgi:hypothetical protein
MVTWLACMLLREIECDSSGCIYILGYLDYNSSYVRSGVSFQNFYKYIILNFKLIVFSTETEIRKMEATGLSFFYFLSFCYRGFFSKVNIILDF